MIELCGLKSVSPNWAVQPDTYGCGESAVPASTPNSKLAGTNSPLKAQHRRRGAAEGLERIWRRATAPTAAERKRLSADDQGVEGALIEPAEVPARSSGFNPTRVPPNDRPSPAGPR